MQSSVFNLLTGHHDMRRLILVYSSKVFVNVPFLA